MGLFSRRPKPTKIQSLDEIEPMLASGKPVLLDFFQVGCGPCQIMDGIINELAEEYDGSAHIVKVDVARVLGAAQSFGVRSTPTFVVMGAAPRKRNKRRATAAQGDQIGIRWRASGLVKKDQLVRTLESNGAVKAGADRDQ